MSKKLGVRHVHKDSVELLQLHGGGQVALGGPGVSERLRAEPRPVRLHQGHRLGDPPSPQEHRVVKGGGRGAVLEGQLHPRINMVESGLVDLQAALSVQVGHASRHKGPSAMTVPSQGLSELLCLDLSWSGRVKQNDVRSYSYVQSRK